MNSTNKGRCLTIGDNRNKVKNWAEMVKNGSDTLKCNIILGRVSSKLARLEALETDNRTVLDYFKR